MAWRTSRWKGMRSLGVQTSLALVLGAALLYSAVALAVWRVATATAAPGTLSRASVTLAVLVPGVLSVALAIATVVVAALDTRMLADPLPVLARMARRIATGAGASIPFQDRAGDVGDLARALRDWQRAATVREVLLRSAPVGICWLSATGHVREVNAAALAILDYTRDQMLGRFMLELVHPDDQHLAGHATVEALAAAGKDRAELESRLLRGDGRWVWCATVTAPVAGEAGQAAGFIVTLEDIEERRRQADWAAAVQREMLPRSAPEVPGYDVAGGCVPVQVVAGDLYDWVAASGGLEITVADVMGKGMGAALVMAALRTALRSSPSDLGPAARVTRAAAAMTFGAETAGMFVTLFHARLEPATGVLRYVDAGHGYCLLRRGDGTIEPLGARSLPLGLAAGEPVVEGRVTLEPGDLLVISSDGIAEVGDETTPLDVLVRGLDASGGAAAMVDHLLARVGGLQTDDASVVVVRRLPAGEERPVGPPRPAPALPGVAGAGATSPPLPPPAPPPDRHSRPAPGEESVRQSLRTILRTRSIVGGYAGMVALAVITGLAEWHLGTAAAGVAHPALDRIAAAGAAGVLAGLPAALLNLVLVARSSRIGLVPVPVLAARARQIAAEGRAPIPYQARQDEIGDLARALWEWQQAAAVRAVLLRSAPVGVLRVSIAGQVIDANRAALAMLGYRVDELVGREAMEMIHPDDRYLTAGMAAEALAAAGRDRGEAEGRFLCGDGTWMWCSAVAAPVAVDGTQVDSFIVILQDVRERKRQADWAATVQREMLPLTAPHLAGYEVAGSCRRAHEVAGDLYDWVELTGGRLELTVADVMGNRGTGAALVMAALRTALRAAPGDLGPADRVTRAASAMPFGSETGGVFMTLFHATLETATGRLRYVDAGHGYCLIRRAGGRTERLRARSLPLGVGLGERVLEGEVRLEPGDVLLVCTDGLVQAADDAPVEDVARELDGAGGAEEMVSRLLARASRVLRDDATAVVLRRLAPTAATAGDPLAASAG